MRIDLHVHASERSDCAVSSEAEMLRAARRRGLAGVAFTDHGLLVPRKRLGELRRRHAPLRIYSGIEVHAAGGDFLVLGLHEPALEEPDWQYPDLRRHVAERGGFLVLAHPLRFQPYVDPEVLTCPPDALEVRSVNMAVCDPAAVGQVLRALGCAALTNSDAHRAADVGAFWNDFGRLPDDDAELVAMLKAGRFQCAPDDRPGA
jgi:histidinol phosphatase-like PHP family hydrolase